MPISHIELKEKSCVHAWWALHFVSFVCSGFQLPWLVGGFGNIYREYMYIFNKKNTHFKEQWKTYFSLTYQILCMWGSVDTSSGVTSRVLWGLAARGAQAAGSSQPFLLYAERQGWSSAPASQHTVRLGPWGRGAHRPPSQQAACPCNDREQSVTESLCPIIESTVQPYSYCCTVLSILPALVSMIRAGRNQEVAAEQHWSLGERE